MNEFSSQNILPMIKFETYFPCSILISIVDDHYFMAASCFGIYAKYSPLLHFNHLEHLIETKAWYE